MKELDEKVSDGIDKKFSKAFEFKDMNEIDASYNAIKEALAMLPSPISQWSESLIIILSACEHFIAINKLEDANELVDEYLTSDYCDAYEDSSRFVKGAILFEMDELEQAKEWFDKANSISKGRCFASQPKKYKTFFNEQK
jgi:tetratricopeptide (TPR) repeat protein